MKNRCINAILIFGTLLTTNFAFANNCDCDNATYSQGEVNACEFAIATVKETDSFSKSLDKCIETYSDNKALLEVCQNKVQVYKSMCQ